MTGKGCRGINAGAKMSPALAMMLVALGAFGVIAMALYVVALALKQSG